MTQQHTSHTSAETDHSTSSTLNVITCIDGSPARAPIVVGEHRDKAVLWQVDILGNLSGAWVIRQGNSQASHRILSICDRRALIGIAADTPVDLVLRWAKDAQVPVTRADLDERVCSIPALLNEVNKARYAYSNAVDEREEQENTDLQPLNWTTKLPTSIPDELDALLDCATVNTETSIPDTRVVLLTARLARWAVHSWIDTEATRMRRPYLRESFGPAQPLPRSWRTPIVAAYKTPFDL